MCDWFLIKQEIPQIFVQSIMQFLRIIRTKVKGKIMRILKHILLTAVLSATWMVTASASTVNYTYDDKGRLWKVTYATGEQIEYLYDAAGNRTTKIVMGSSANGPSSANSGVVVLPISGFIVIPLGDPNCTVLAGCS